MNKKTVAIFAICMLLVSALSVFTTLAFLTDKSETVTNTFTSGDVKITLDEALVDTNGQATTGDRVTKNEYKIIPTKEYDKDPTLTLEAGSENSYLGAKITLVGGNLIKTKYGIADINTVLTSKLSITLLNGWEIKDADIVDDNIIYYLAIDDAQAPDRFVIFDGFTAPDTDGLTADLGKTVTETYSELFATVKIEIDGFAVQSAENEAANGFEAIKAAFRTDYAPAE